jgi:branched-chain amino acid transport system substrate-binding protein
MSTAVLAGLLVAACGGGQPAPFYLATVYNTTGAQAVLDVPSSNGSTLKVDELNSGGGVAGHQLSMVQVEGDSQAATLTAGVESALTDQPDVLAFLGLSDTDMVLAAAPTAAAHGRVFLTSGATSPMLPAQVPEYLFLACFGDNVQAAAGAEWAYQTLGARSAAVIYDPNRTYTDLLQGYFVVRFSQLGGTIASSTPIDPRADQLQVPSVGSVDLVFLSVETAADAARVIALLRSAGYSGPILGGDGYDAPSVWAQAPTITSVFFTTHVYLGADNPDPHVTAFLAAYKQAYPGQEPNSFAALGYDAVGLLAAALERAPAATAAGVVDGLSGLQDYAGVTGTISFPGDSRIPIKSVALVGVANGEQHLQAELTPSSVPNP